MSMQRRKRRGASAVEFALIAPPLFMVLAGVMEYGWFFFNQIILDSAAREGARIGARTAPDATPTPSVAASDAAVAFWTSMGIPGSPSFVTSGATSAGETLIIVSGTLPYTGLIGFYTPVPNELRARVAVRSEF